MTLGPVFDLQPTLRGKSIELRPLKPDDFTALYEAARDPLIWEQHPESDRYEPDVFQRYFDGAIESRGAFAIIDRKTGRIIGSSRYCDLRPEESQVEIGWTFLERAYWGGKHNGELKTLMIDHAFKFVNRVVFVVGENNLRSRRALEKIGARFLTRAEATAPNGTIRKNVIYAIERGPT
jgi:RimJ/RimL family protein N-acetyltransferase